MTEPYPMPPIMTIVKIKNLREQIAQVSMGMGYIPGAARVVALFEAVTEILQLMEEEICELQDR